MVSFGAEPWSRPLLYAVVAVTLLGWVPPAKGQCGQGPVAGKPACTLRSDASMPLPVVDGSAVSLNDTLFVFARGDEAVPPQTLGLATTGGQKWLTYDALPRPYLTGPQMSVVVYPLVYIFACASEDTRAYNYSGEVYVFDAAQEPGSQFSTIITAIPKRTHSRVIAVGGRIYVTSGHGNGTTLSVDPVTWQITEVPNFAPATLDFLFLSDAIFLYAVGGRDGASLEWSDAFYIYNIEQGAEDTTVRQKLYRPVPEITGVMIGPYIYVIDWVENPLLIGVWSNFSKAFTTSSIDTEEQYANRTDFAVAQRVIEGVPVVYVLGGTRGDITDVEGEDSPTTDVFHVSTGIQVPTFSLDPVSPHAGPTEEEPGHVQVSAVGVPALSSYALRLSSTADCRAPLPGSQDMPFANTVNFTLGPESPGYAYVCFSIGGCPDDGAEGAECSYLRAPEGGDGLGVGEGMCALGCCRTLSPEACLAPQNDSKVAVFFTLSVTPLWILPYDVTPVPDTEAPAPYAPPTHTFSVDKTLAIVMMCLIILCVIGSCVAYATYVKLQPRDQHIQLSCNNDSYEPIEKLGSGSYGVVYLVRRKDDGLLYAMKYIACRSDEAREEAMKEFAVLRGFQGHPHMVRVVETFMNWSQSTALPLMGAAHHNSSDVKSGKSRGSDIAPNESTPLRGSEIMDRELPSYVCIVMQYYREGDLGRYITSFAKAGKVIPELTIVSFVKQICSLLKDMHASDTPLVHRDLKPENILLQDDCRGVVVTDFGLARNIETTYCNTQVGSLPYVAPECWERHYGREVDIWALGCIAYAAASRRCQPHNTRVMFSDTLRDTVGLHTSIAEELRQDGYSSAFVALVLSMIAKHRDDRPTAEQLYATTAKMLPEGYSSQAMRSPLPNRPDTFQNKLASTESLCTSMDTVARATPELRL